MNINRFLRLWCIQYVKDTDFKANYNATAALENQNYGVFNMSKIQISKQITTRILRLWSSTRCIQYVKDTDFKANYNVSWGLICQLSGVLNMSKIQISKQITTLFSFFLPNRWCIQYVKDTDFKANYNMKGSYESTDAGVFNMSKIQISKQITTSVTFFDIF